MASKNIKILMRLSDQFTKPMIKATNATKNQEKAVRSAQTKIVKFVNTANNRFLSLSKSISRVALGMAGLGGVLSVAGLKSFASEAIDAANVQIEAEKKLYNALKNVDSIAEGGTASIKAANEQLLKCASNLQKVGVIGDEVTIAGMQQLATYGLNADQIETLSAGMDDMLVKIYGMEATGENAVTVAKALGKAMTGSYTSLSKYGITLSDAEKTQLDMLSEAERAAALAKIIEGRIGGINQEMAATPEGQIQQARNAYGDMLEEIGMKLLPLKAQLVSFAAQYIPAVQNAVTSAIDAITPVLQSAMDYIKNNQDQIKERLSAIGSFIKNLWSIVKPALKFIVKHADTIGAILVSIGAVFVALNLAMKIMAIVSAIQTVITVVGAVAAAFTSFGTAAAAAELMAMAPIAPLVLAIMGIIAVLVIVIKHWDQIKAKTTEVLGKIKDGISQFVSHAKEQLQKVVDFVNNIIDKIKEALQFLQDLATGTANASGGMSASGLTTVPGFATGTPYASGGVSRINEGGRGEIVNLPSGTQIIPHDVAKKSTGGTNVTVNLTVSGNVIGNRDFMESVGSYVSDKVINALGVV